MADDDTPTTRIVARSAGGPGHRAAAPRPGRRRRVLVGVAAVAVLATLGAVGVVVLGRPATAVAQETGMLRLAHLSPATPAVDMYASGPNLPPTKVASDVSYRGITGYVTEPAGTYRLQARPAGASPDSPAALDVSVDVPAGSAQTAAFVDVGPAEATQTQVLSDSTAAAPAGRGLLRVVAAAVDVGPLAVDAVGGPPLARDLFYGSSTPYAELPAGPAQVRVQSRAGGSETVPVPLASGFVGTLVVTRAAEGGLRAETVPDAASSAPAANAPAPAPAAPGTPPTTSSDPSSALPPAPKAPTPPRAGVGAGLGGLAPRSWIDDLVGSEDAAPAVPYAARLPEASATAPEPGGIRPTGLRVPGAGVEAAGLEDLRVDYRGELAVPADYSRVGWYSASAVPGDPGPAVLVGHVDTRRGPAVFAQLDRLRPGDPVEVPRSDGTTARFVVDNVAYYAKDQLPTQLVYGPTASPQLRLLTCGGPFDQQALSYRDNLVVYASQR